MPKSLWICIRTRGVLRRFLRIGTARDGAIYTTLGRKNRGGVSYRGELQIPAGQVSASHDISTGEKRTFPSYEGHHTGYKPSGAIYSKFGAGDYSIMRLTALQDLREPLLLEQVYPAPLDGFDSISAPRRADVVVPDMVIIAHPSGPYLSIEDRFGTDPFHFELYAVPTGKSFAVPDPITIGFAVEFETPRFHLAGIFRQDQTDLSRGWLDNTRTLRAMFESSTSEQSC